MKSEKQRRRRPLKSLGGRLLSTSVTVMLTTSTFSSSNLVVGAFQQIPSAHSLSTAQPRTVTRRFFRDTADSSATVTTTTPEGFWELPPSEHHQQGTSVSHHTSVHNSIPFQPWQPTASSGVTPSSPPYSTTTETSSTTATQEASQPITSQSSQQYHQYHPPKSRLPAWLSESKDASWEAHWHRLEETMLESFFTPQETQRLLQTIEFAARGNRHQMASAAEFCLILVETMEMGLTALMAASHHICACLTARHSAAFEEQLWDQAFAGAQQCVEDDFHSDHVKLIARDAGRLKTLEMVAAMIYSDQASVRVAPDAEDARNLRSLLLTECKDWRALAIRSAAALYRLKGLESHSSTRQNYGVVPRTAEAMQASREALYIYAPLASQLGMHRLKNELEGAAFKILYRRQSNRVRALARELRPRHSRPHLTRGLVEMCDNSLDISSCMKSVLETVQAEMSQLLRDDPHFAKHVRDFSVTARVKEPYSLWKKMLRNKCRHIMEVPDAIALRIVLEAREVEGEDDAVRRARERALCYYAQELCLRRWQPSPVDGRFKDYIESPKHNGYQSLHYTAHTMWDNEDFQFEIQVRTGEMHQVAEFGLASHWDYKAQQKQHRDGQPNQSHPRREPEVTISSSAYSNDAYIRSVQEWHWQHHSGTNQDSNQWITEAASIDAGTRKKEHVSSIAEEEFSANSLDSTERTDRIRARTQKLQPYIEALAAAQSDLAREHVFVFLTSEDESALARGDSMQTAQQHGRVLSLPAGSCVLDALREGEREMGIAFPDHHRLNGEFSTKVTSLLQNGDILTVPLRSTPTASVA